MWPLACLTPWPSAFSTCSGNVWAAGRMRGWAHLHCLGPNWEYGCLHLPDLIPLHPRGTTELFSHESQPQDLACSADTTVPGWFGSMLPRQALGNVVLCLISNGIHIFLHVKAWAMLSEAAWASRAQVLLESMWVISGLGPLSAFWGRIIAGYMYSAEIAGYQYFWDTAIQLSIRKSLLLQESDHR